MISEILKDIFNVFDVVLKTTERVIDHLETLAYYEIKWIMNKLNKNKNRLSLCC